MGINNNKTIYFYIIIIYLAHTHTFVCTNTVLAQWPGALENSKPPHDINRNSFIRERNSNRSSSHLALENRIRNGVVTYMNLLDICFTSFHPYTSQVPYSHLYRETRYTCKQSCTAKTTIAKRVWFVTVRSH